MKNIAALLQRHGHSVEQKLGGVETAFRAQVGPPGPAVALLAEYDALPEIGHACGHNLIAMSNVGAFLLAAERAKDLGVGVALVGTPAEESGGGKIDLIDAGVFRDSVAVLSSHPSGDPDWEFGGSSLGVVAKRVDQRPVVQLELLFELVERRQDRRRENAAEVEDRCIKLSHGRAGSLPRYRKRAPRPGRL